MRFLVMVVSAGAALTLIGASGFMNHAFMTSLGKSEAERQILGAVSIAVSAFLALLPTLLLWAYRERRLVYVMLGVPVFLAFAAFSLSSAVGFAAKNRGSLSEERALVTERLAGVNYEIADIETKLARFGTVKPSSVLAEALHGLEQDRRWQSSKACEAATAEASRSFCKSYFELKGEAARSSEAERLEARLAGLKRESAHLREQGAGREADNQAAVLARFLGVDAKKVERGLMLSLAVLVEIGAALGLYFATAHMRTQTSSFHAHTGRRAMIVEREVLNTPSQTTPARVPAKKIAAIVPRRVARLSRS